MSEVDLAQIALKLDENEKKLMQEMGETEDYIKYLAEDSGNVALDGNYSVQVIAEALKVWDLSCISLTSNEEEIKEAKRNPSKEEAFICNLQSHWFTIKKVGGHWWNLNSLLENGPEYVGEVYLSAFLETLVQEGYSIFLIRGNFPPPNLSSSFDNSGRGVWVTRFPPGANNRNPTPSNQNTFLPFSTPGYSLSPNPNHNNSFGVFGIEGGGGGEFGMEDEEFQKALALSLETEKEEKLKKEVEKLPEEPSPTEKEATHILVRTQSGEIKRRFLKTEPIQNLLLFLHSKGCDMSKYKLFTVQPSLQLTDMSLSFEKASLHPRSVLILK